MWKAWVSYEILLKIHFRMRYYTAALFVCLKSRKAFVLLQGQAVYLSLAIASQDYISSTTVSCPKYRGLRCSQPGWVPFNPHSPFGSRDAPKPLFPPWTPTCKDPWLSSSTSRSLFTSFPVPCGSQALVYTHMHICIKCWRNLTCFSRKVKHDDLLGMVHVREE